MTNADRVQLDAFLASPARPEGTLRLNELEGFLFAVACSPDVVMPSEWQPMIFGGEEANFEDLDEARAVLESLMALYNRVNADVFNGSYRLPPACEPSDDLNENFGPTGAPGQWSRGFALGQGWLGESWDAHLPDERSGELGALMMVLSFFSSRPLAESFAEEFRPGSTAEELGEIVRTSFARAVAEFVDLALSVRSAPGLEESANPARPTGVKVGRNEPCPCGSGKKYKRCCGAS